MQWRKVQEFMKEDSVDIVSTRFQNVSSLSSAKQFSVSSHDDIRFWYADIAHHSHDAMSIFFGPSNSSSPLFR